MAGTFRLAYCFACRNIERLDGFDGLDFNDPNSHENDVVLKNWIDRHQHGLDTSLHPREPGAHPGARIFPFDSSREGVDTTITGDREKGGTTHTGVELDALTMKAVEEVKKLLADNHMEVNEVRDQLREDAVLCHQRHGQPNRLEGRGCIDYHADDKRLGRRNMPPHLQRWLCTFCPYESTVTVVKRANRGDYKK